MGRIIDPFCRRCGLMKPEHYRRSRRNGGFAGWLHGTCECCAEAIPCPRCDAGPPDTTPLEWEISFTGITNCPCPQVGGHDKEVTSDVNVSATLTQSDRFGACTWDIFLADAAMGDTYTGSACSLGISSHETMDLEIVISKSSTTNYNIGLSTANNATFGSVLLYSASVTVAINDCTSDLISIASDLTACPIPTVEFHFAFDGTATCTAVV